MRVWRHYLLDASEQRVVLVDGMSAAKVDNHIFIFGKQALNRVRFKRFPITVQSKKAVFPSDLLREILVISDFFVIADTNLIHVSARKAKLFSNKIAECAFASADWADQDDFEDHILLKTRSASAPFTH